MAENVEFSGSESAGSEVCQLWRAFANTFARQCTSEAAEAECERRHWKPRLEETQAKALLHQNEPIGATSDLPDVAGLETPPSWSEEPDWPAPRFHRSFVGTACAWQMLSEHPSNAEVKKLLDQDGQQRPVVLRGLQLLPALGRWDLTYLKEHMGGPGRYHVFRALQESGEFTYFFENKNAGNFQALKPNEALQMTFEEFLTTHRASANGRQYYLQTPLLQWEDGNPASNPGLDEVMLKDLGAIDMEAFRQLSDTLELGSPHLAQLFVSGFDAFSPLHYDQQQNIYLQVRGAKRFLLFSPCVSYAFYPYPVQHPLDRKARVDLRADPNTSTRAWPFLEDARGKGIEVVLLPGDVLFLPTHWWHAVQSLECDNVSLNFWFDGGGAAAEPSPPEGDGLRAARTVELARHAEAFLCDQLGPGWTLTSVVAQKPRDTIEERHRRRVYGYLCRQLRTAFGHDEQSFLRILHAQRWSGICARASSLWTVPDALMGTSVPLQILLAGLHAVTKVLRQSGKGEAAFAAAAAVQPPSRMRRLLEGVNAEWHQNLSTSSMHSLVAAADLGKAQSVAVWLDGIDACADWLMSLDAFLFASEPGLVKVCGPGSEMFAASLVVGPQLSDTSLSMERDKEFVLRDCVSPYFRDDKLGRDLLYDPLIDLHRATYGTTVRACIKPSSLLDTVVSSVLRKMPSGLLWVGVQRGAEQRTLSLEQHIEAVQRLCTREVPGEICAVLVAAGKDAVSQFADISGFPVFQIPQAPDPLPQRLLISWLFAEMDFVVGCETKVALVAAFAGQKVSFVQASDILKVEPFDKID